MKETVYALRNTVKEVSNEELRKVSQDNGIR
jgi:hypothetical protein